MPSVELPPDVVAYVGGVFSEAAESAAARLSRMPTSHEEALDFAMVDAFLEAAGPHRTASGVVFDVDVHWVGGGAHWQRWEIADLGVIFVVRRGPELLLTKVVLLQSKRLYPREVEFVPDRGLARPGGFGGLWQEPDLAAYGPRTFHFEDACRYQAMRVGDDQWLAIEQYETRFGIPVHYLLYHPRDFPAVSTIPVSVPLAPVTGTSPVGTRVLAAAALRSLLRARPANHAPTYGELTDASGAPGLGLSRFVTDRVLPCHEGYLAAPGPDAGLARIFNQRSGPIAAAVRFDINLAEVATDGDDDR